METSAQVVLFGLDDHKVYVTELVFPLGDSDWDRWREHPLGISARVTDVNKANCWVHYASEDGLFITLPLKFPQASVAIAWFRAINDIGYSEGYGRRGRPPALENQRKTWKEAQGKTPQRRIYRREEPVRLDPPAPPTPKAPTRTTNPSPTPVNDEDFGATQAELDRLVGKNAPPPTIL